MSKTELEKIVYQTSELEKIEGLRFGTLVDIDAETNKIWVDFKDNPFNKPITAALGTPWITVENLLNFVECIDSIKLDFLEGDPARPVVRDLLYSLNDLNRLGSDLLQDKKIEIEADEIILRGKTQIIIESGDARTTYRAEGNEIVEEADQIDSSANKNNRIKGGKILLN